MMHQPIEKEPTGATLMSYRDYIQLFEEGFTLYKSEADIAVMLPYQTSGCIWLVQ